MFAFLVLEEAEASILAVVVDRTRDSSGTLGNLVAEP